MKANKYDLVKILFFLRKITKRKFLLKEEISFIIILYTFAT